jgi:serine/threonine protein kinase
MALPPPWRPSSPSVTFESGQAYVDKVNRPDSDQDFALKRLKNVNRRERRERFTREVKIAKALSDSGLPVVEIYEAIFDADRPYFVMPWMSEGTLEDLALGGSRAEPIPALALLDRVAAALQAVHELRLAHRDIKPSNILLATSTEPVLGDFGLCLQADEDAERLTATAEAIGSRFYTAPENESGVNEDVDQRPADFYAFGKVIYAVLTGRQPLARERLLEPGSRLHEVTDNNSFRYLEPLLQQLLVTDPRARLTDWDAVRRELRSFIGNLQGSAPPERPEDSNLLDLAHRIGDLHEIVSIRRQLEDQGRPERLYGELRDQLNAAAAAIDDRLRQLTEATDQAVTVTRQPTGGVSFEGLGQLNQRAREIIERIPKPLHYSLGASPYLGAASTLPGGRILTLLTECIASWMCQTRPGSWRAPCSTHERGGQSYRISSIHISSLKVRWPLDFSRPLKRSVGLLRGALMTSVNCLDHISVPCILREVFWTPIHG